MKRDIKKMFVINAAVYPFDTVVAIGQIEADIVKYIESELKYELDNEEKTYFVKFAGKGKTLQLKNGTGVLWVKRFNDGPFSHGVLSHEIFHVAYQILCSVGIKLTDSSEEAFSYLIQYLTQEILYNIYKK